MHRCRIEIDEYEPPSPWQRATRAWFGSDLEKYRRDRELVTDALRRGAKYVNDDLHPMVLAELRMYFDISIETLGCYKITPKN